ncbi:MAG: CsgE family curli-type amyloid fiber assembly protein [Pseudomonadota bacterium]
MVIWLLCLGQGPAFAANIDQEIETNDRGEIGLEDEGISGIIVDNTVTIIGRRFYDAFSIAWPDYKVGKDENFSIHEQPTARSGSHIWIEHNRKRLFEVFLSPVMANIVDTSRSAAKSVSNRFETLQHERMLFSDPDLAADEI